MFFFEKLDVYQKALVFAASTDEILESANLFKSDVISDQLRRASLSIVLNIAEGNGRWQAADKKHFFVMARGSLLECVAILQVMRLKKLLAEDIYNQNYQHLEEIAKMLTGLIRSIKSQ